MSTQTCLDDLRVVLPQTFILHSLFPHSLLFAMTRLERIRSKAVTVLAAASLAAASTSTVAPRATWPNGPFTTNGRWMLDANNATVTYAGVNWPGSLDAMVPEGLQYQSIESIVSMIKSVGMNAIRLTYATEMIDQYYDNGESDVTIQRAFTDALGQDAGSTVFNAVITNNPSFDNQTTRLQVFDAIAAECARQEIYVHLDNHLSQAGWCCNPTDGNGWWGDTYFNVDNWSRGLSFMANHGRSWSNLMSMSLRNELRVPLTNSQVASTYTWEDWYTYMRQGSDAIHAANPDVLIFLSGLDSDKDLSVVVDGSNLTPGSARFSKNDFAGYGNKLVLELHAYDNIFTFGASSECSSVEDRLNSAGFEALDDDANHKFPVLLTEFGLEQNSTTAQDSYASCLLNFVSSRNAGWMIWQIGGSYYIREGTQDYDEQWGLLSHDWSDWRAPDFVNNLNTTARSTLSVDGTVPELEDDSSAPRFGQHAAKWATVISISLVIAGIAF
ncbi:glycoside hydrolase superfamily [Camillea tinctor]|nr:glycoside hydrolase superfamily [Camillea tinctor]